MQKYDVNINNNNNYAVPTCLEPGWDSDTFAGLRIKLCVCRCLQLVLGRFFVSQCDIL